MIIKLLFTCCFLCIVIPLGLLNLYPEEIFLVCCGIAGLTLLLTENK